MRTLFGGVFAGLIAALLVGVPLRPSSSPSPATEPPRAQGEHGPSCPTYQPLPPQDWHAVTTQLQTDLARLQARLDVEVGTPLPSDPNDEPAAVRGFFDGLDLGPYTLRLDCTEHPCVGQIDLGLEDAPSTNEHLAAPWTDAIAAAYPGARTEVAVHTGTDTEEEPVLRIRTSLHTAVAQGQGQERRLTWRWIQFDRAR